MERYPNFSASENYTRESVTWCIPDFSAHWGNFNFERIHHVFKLNDQEPTGLNGEYVLYWCCNDELPPNRCLMSLLGLESLQIHEHFWYGDVFITRFHEDEKTFKFSCEDVPRAFLGWKGFLTNMLVSLWENKEPEDEIREWQHFDSQQEKHNANMQIILGRLSRNERKVLKQIPGMLDYLAITIRDDGALLKSSFQESKDHPGMTEISTVCRPTALEQKGWKGFSADDL